MKKNLLILAPLSMLALAACNQSDTAAEEAAAAETAAMAAAPIELPPAITSTGTYRCADNTILYIDFFGDNVAADIRIENKTALATRVNAPKAEGEEEATGPMTSDDGEATLTGTGKQIVVKLPGKGSQTCKS